MKLRPLPASLQACRGEQTCCTACDTCGFELGAYGSARRTSEASEAAAQEMLYLYGCARRHCRRADHRHSMRSVASEAEEANASGDHTTTSLYLSVFGTMGTVVCCVSQPSRLIATRDTDELLLDIALNATAMSTSQSSSTPCLDPGILPLLETNIPPPYGVSTQLQMSRQSATSGVDTLIETSTMLWTTSPPTLVGAKLTAACP